MCTVFIYYVYLNTHIQYIFKIFTCIYIYIIIFYSIYINIYNIQTTYFAYIYTEHACVCIYIYIINIHGKHSYCHLVLGARRNVNNPFMERGTWNVERGTWNVERGTWNVERGTWNVERGGRQTPTDDQDETPETGNTGLM